MKAPGRGLVTAKARGASSPRACQTASGANRDARWNRDQLWRAQPALRTGRPCLLGFAAVYARCYAASRMRLHRLGVGLALVTAVGALANCGARTGLGAGEACPMSGATRPCEGFCGA